MRPERHGDVATVDLTGRTALVTGGTAGIGHELAVALSRLGATVLVTGRDESRGAAAVEALRGAGPGEHAFYPVEFADMAAVRELAETIAADTETLDLLVNNAGAIFREAALTPDGVERTVAVNYLAHFVLTHGLYSSLRAAPDGHVVAVSSNGHRFADWAPEWLTSIEDYGAFEAYNRSKLALLMFSMELAGRSDVVRSNALHPGFVTDSEFYRGYPTALRRLLPILRYIPRAIIRRPVVTAAEGAGNVLHVAVSPETSGTTGTYYDCQRPAEPGAAAQDPAARAALWDRSTALADVEWSP